MQPAVDVRSNAFTGITHVNEKQLKGVDALIEIIQSKMPGDLLKLSLTRSGKKMKLDVKLGTKQ
jgi:S1-C subfamily serine protease